MANRLKCPYPFLPQDRDATVPTPSATNLGDSWARGAPKRRQAAGVGRAAVRRRLMGGIGSVRRSWAGAGQGRHDGSMASSGEPSGERTRAANPRRSEAGGPRDRARSQLFGRQLWRGHDEEPGQWSCAGVQGPANSASCLALHGRTRANDEGARPGPAGTRHGALCRPSNFPIYFPHVDSISRCFDFFTDQFQFDVELVACLRRDGVICNPISPVQFIHLIFICKGKIVFFHFFLTPLPAIHGVGVD